MAKTTNEKAPKKAAKKSPKAVTVKLADWLHTSARDRGIPAGTVAGLREKVRKTASDKSVREMLEGTDVGATLLKRYDGFCRRGGSKAGKATA